MKKKQVKQSRSDFAYCAMSKMQINYSPFVFFLFNEALEILPINAVKVLSLSSKGNVFVLGEWVFRFYDLRG